ncbi:MAG: fasciclin domain-containing protein [Methanomassiliicoccus sp.]|nr:fasciclin domain-containing protein [Methanomassiliicoccus sp.]
MKKGMLIAIASMAVVLCVLAGYAGTAAQTTTAPSNTIAQTAEENSDLSTLVTALNAAGLVDALNGTGPFTVFAPTNEAFAKLDPALLQKLTTTDVATLKQILLYHVASGEVMAGDLEDCQQIVTLQGGTVTVHIIGSDVYINDAKVIITDIQASNGVIHVIDTVLMPPAC